jgi:hypothetical protein
MLWALPLWVIIAAIDRHLNELPGKANLFLTVAGKKNWLLKQKIT